MTSFSHSQLYCTVFFLLTEIIRKPEHFNFTLIRQIQAITFRQIMIFTEPLFEMWFTSYFVCFSKHLSQLLPVVPIKDFNITLQCTFYDTLQLGHSLHHRKPRISTALHEYSSQIQHQVVLNSIGQLNDLSTSNRQRYHVHSLQSTFFAC